jgi:hypothetical protein
MMLCHKDRWLGNQGEERFIGYEGGKYVPYTREFEEATRARQVDKVDAIAGDPKPAP